MFKLFKRTFCDHNYVLIEEADYFPGSKLLTGSKFIYKCKKCGKRKKYSTKWW